MDNRQLLSIIQNRLDSLLQKYPNHSIITVALDHVRDLQMDFSKEGCVLLANELTSLQVARIWGDSEDDQKLLNELQMISEPLRSQSREIDIKIDFPNQKIPQILHHDLPLEILDSINETFLLHAVSMHPSKILPPGKSILSIISSGARRRNDSLESAPEDSKSLRQQVSNIVFKAFWDEAFDSLSSSEAAVQLTRLHLLYLDLHKAVEPLVPPSLPIMHTLSSPLSPTSSPLRSASVHLKELLAVLRARCAPIRDDKFDELSNRLEASYEELPQACIDVIKGILELADLMKADMADFITGTWTEREAINWLRQQAMDRERNSIIEMFTLPKLKESYQTWLSEVEFAEDQPDERRLVNRLIQALGKNQPVSPFPPSTNLLPPPLMYSAFDFIRVQNLIQALVISASLRILVHRYLKENSNDWLTRIWTLLESEIDMEVQNTSDNASNSNTRLINLEDEVVSVSGFRGVEGEQLREAVRRILRVEDPAFKLLQSRLLEGIRKRLLIQQPISRVPNLLKSGKGNSSLNKERFEPEVEEDLIVKGFEEPVLMSNIREVISSLRTSLMWFKETWTGILF